VPEQIAILLALDEKLFDPVAIDQMIDALQALTEAAAKIPKEVSGRFDTAEKLSDEDRATVLGIAREALAPFQPKPAPDVNPKAVGKGGSKTDPPDRERS
jgi:F-type H+-transporting ATPase subunit alpha